MVTAYIALGSNIGPEKHIPAALAELAARGVAGAIERDPALAVGVNTMAGGVVNEPVAAALGRPHLPLADALAAQAG